MDGAVGLCSAHGKEVNVMEKTHIEKEIPEIDIDSYKNRVSREYRASKIYFKRGDCMV